jgi:hypothetical protein
MHNLNDSPPMDYSERGQIVAEMQDKLSWSLQVAELARLLPFMDLGMFSVHQRQEVFEELINDVAGLFERLQDAEALSACALMLVHAASVKHPAAANTAVQTAQVLVDTCSQQLISAVDVVGQTSDTQLAVRGLKLTLLLACH